MCKEGLLIEDFDTGYYHIKLAEQIPAGDMVWISVCTDTVILANYFSNLIKIAP